jgi:iron complex outermembrane receptor protein
LEISDKTSGTWESPTRERFHESGFGLFLMWVSAKAAAPETGPLDMIFAFCSPKNATLPLLILLYLAAMPPARAQDPQQTPEVVEVTATRLGTQIPGTSTSVITSADIASDPSLTLTDILARQAGLQTQSLFGGVNGADVSVGLRGFAATATQNTLITVNGRRLNDPDQSSVDLSSIPLSSIERVEIVRGSSASVLYGDGAVGGVINIITRNGYNAPSAASVDVVAGSDSHHEVSASFNQNFGSNSVSVFGSDINDDGYRDNNALRERSAVAEFRHTTSDGGVYVNLRIDDQYLGLPGPLDLLSTTQILYPANPRTASSPNDFAQQSSVNLSAGGTMTIGDGIELVLDGGLRHKNQDSYFVSYGDYSAVTLTSLTLTPRLEATQTLFGMSGKLLTGVDFEESFRQAGLSPAKDQPPSYGYYGMTFTRYSAYAMENLTLSPQTEISAGGRVEQFAMNADEPLNVVTNPKERSTQFALHLGIDHQIEEGIGIFARIGHSLRLPNIDDLSYVAPENASGLLKPQTAWDTEAGTKIKFGRFDGQFSAYGMNLRDEIDYDSNPNPLYNGNVNFAPTRRLGVEAQAGLTVTSTLRLTAMVTETDASYRSGTYAGKTVPQVAGLTGNLGMAWDLWQKYLTLDVDARYVGKRRFGDDQSNAFPEQPAYELVDVKIGGKVESLRWSFSVLNVLNAHYFDQGYAQAASSYGPATLSIYPMPGRVFLGHLGVTF